MKHNGELVLMKNNNYIEPQLQRGVVVVPLRRKRKHLCLPRLLLLLLLMLWFLLLQLRVWLWTTQTHWFYRMMAVILTPSPHLAAVVSSAFYSFWKLLSGFLVPKPDGGYGLIWLLQFCCIVTIDLHFFSHRWSPLTKFESTSPSVCINMADSQCHDKLL